MRHDLLERTFKSFMENADVPPASIVIVEDSDLAMPGFLNAFRHIPTTWLNNGVRRGQVYSLDLLYRHITTDYVFHLEDDFEFTGSGFLRKSHELLEKYPDICLVALRTDWGHPIADGDPQFPSSLKIAMPYWREIWGGYAWNPGLRRLSDIKKFGPVSKYGKQNGLEHEALLSKAFLDAGYRIANLPHYCHHIGEGRSKAAQKIEQRDIKILIAVKAGQTLSYTKWESEKSPHFDISIAYQGKPYDTGDKPIHVSGPNNRIPAVRETWFKDIQKFPNVTGKFFFGQPTSANPLDDEVYLDVPDDYAHLAPKTGQICKYAVDHDFDYAVFVDDDTFVFVDRLVAEIESASFDYGGHAHGEVCTGGPGYILSRRALNEVVRNHASHWAEDVSVAVTMRHFGVLPTNLIGHRSGKSNHHFFTGDRFDPSLLASDIVTMHAVFPDAMRQCYEYKTSH